jgi:hypothetical protein
MFAPVSTAEAPGTDDFRKSSSCAQKDNSTAKIKAETNVFLFSDLLQKGIENEWLDLAYLLCVQHERDEALGQPIQAVSRALISPCDTRDLFS